MSLIVGVNPSNTLQNCETTAAGHLKVDLASSGGGAISANVDVTGNSIGLATQATLAANGAIQSDIKTEVTSMDSKITACNTGAVVVASSALPTGASTEATALLAEAHLGTIDTSTATASTTLTGISAKLPAALGQLTMANSLSVAVASNQSAIPVSSAGANVTASSESASPTAGTTTNSTAADMNGFQHVAIFGTTSNTTDQFKVQFSNDNSAFFTNQTAYVGLTSGGNFAINLDNVAARYVRVSQGNTTGSGQTLTIITSKK